MYGRRYKVCTPVTTNDNFSLFYRSFVVLQKLVTPLSDISQSSAQLRLQNIAKLHIPWALLRQITACPFHRTCLVITLQYHKHLDDTDIQLFAV